MSQYTSPGEWCAPVGGIRYRSTTPLPWEIGYKGSGLIVTVPKGVEFDVSIPPRLQWLFDPHNPSYLKAAALHDHLLLAGYDRWTAGSQFHQALKSDGVNRVVRLTMSLAVLLFKYN